MDGFWSITPFEFNVHAKAYAEELKSRIDFDRSIAWATAALSRAKTLPTYDRWMGNNKARPLVGEEARMRHEQHMEDVASYEAYKKRKA